MKLNTKRHKGEMDVGTYKSAMETHKKAMRNVSPKVDNKPNPMLAGVFMRIDKLQYDNTAMKRLLHDNIDLLKRINRIQRTHGKTANVKEQPLVKQVRKCTSNYDEIQRENYKLGCRIILAKSSIDTRMSSNVLNERTQRKVDEFAVPYETLEKCSDIWFTNNVKTLTKLLRPKVYFDLEVENIHPLGRIVIQLFTEACPEVVLSFARACTYQKASLFNFIRIFPQLWAEGELTIEGTDLPLKNLKFDPQILNHGYCAGILSFSKHSISVKGRLLNFSISFKPIPVLNGHRIAFGVITRGLKVLDTLQDYGSKNGKTKKNIIIVKCGLCSPKK